MDPEFKVLRQKKDPSYSALDTLYNRIAIHGDSQMQGVNAPKKAPEDVLPPLDLAVSTGS